jgi:hypothetical protein
MSTGLGMLHVEGKRRSQQFHMNKAKSGFRVEAELLFRSSSVGTWCRNAGCRAVAK